MKWMISSFPRSRLVVRDGKAAAEVAKETVVELAHPGLSRADDTRALASWARHYLEVRHHVDDAQPRERSSAASRPKHNPETTSHQGRS